MQFIEQLLGLSPDGGTGLTEMVMLSCVLAGVAFAYLRGITGKRKRIGSKG